MRQPADADEGTRHDGAGRLGEEMRALALASRQAARALAHAPTAQKDEALRNAAAALRKGARRILAENRADLSAARKAGQSEAFLDRLALDPGRLDGIAQALLEV